MLLDQLSKTCAHLLHKPGAAFFPQQRPIEPVVLGDLFEEPNPHVCGMFPPEFSNRIK